MSYWNNYKAIALSMHYETGAEIIYGISAQ